MAVRRKQAHAYHHGDLRRALLDAARVELHKVGMQQLSLRGVARRAGVTHAAAYHHFADKDALLRRVAQEGFEKLYASMIRGTEEAGPDADPVARLRGAGVGYLRFALDDPQALMLMFDGTSPEGDEELQAAARRAFEKLVECVVAARAFCRLPGDPVPDAMLHWSIVHGFSALARAGRMKRAGITDPVAYGSALLDRIMAIYPSPDPSAPALAPTGPATAAATAAAMAGCDDDELG